jgi:hypothetical protein
MLNSSREQIGLHQAKNVREPIDIEVPQKNIKTLFYPLTWSNGFSVGRGKRGGLEKIARGPWQKNAKIFF